jgi:hypothetical protein
VQTTITWNTLNTAKYIEGDIQTINAVPIMTSYNTPNGLVQYSTDGGGNGGKAWRLFDRLWNYWSATISTGYVSYKFYSPRIIKKYTIRSVGDAVSYKTPPKNWTLYI